MHESGQSTVGMGTIMKQAKTQADADVDTATVGAGIPVQPTPSSGPIGKAWWRHPMVWLVISGPALVVVAGFFTLWLAISNPDPIVAESPARTEAVGHAETLAQTARNHAATSRGKP